MSYESKDAIVRCRVTRTFKHRMQAFCERTGYDEADLVRRGVSIFIDQEEARYNMIIDAARTPPPPPTMPPVPPLPPQRTKAKKRRPKP